MLAPPLVLSLQLKPVEASYLTPCFSVRLKRGCVKALALTKHD